MGMRKNTECTGVALVLLPVGTYGKTYELFRIGLPSSRRGSSLAMLALTKYMKNKTRRQMQTGCEHGQVGVGIVWTSVFLPHGLVHPASSVKTLEYKSDERSTNPEQDKME